MSWIRDALSQPGVILQRWAFEGVIGSELCRADPRLPRDQAERMATIVADEVLADAKEWGNPDYAWDADAAVTVAHEIEIRHWEPTS